MPGYVSPVVTADTWNGFLDPSEVAAHPWVGALRVADTAVPTAPDDVPLRVVATGGASQLAGPAALCVRRGLRLVAVETALRDLDDPAGNARRVVAAAADLPDGVRVHVAVPGDPTPAGLAALDELAAADLALTLDPRADLDGWVDAALDRELVFSLTGGDVAAAVAALRTTARLWGDADDLLAARRWCTSWACADLAAAITYLEGVA